MLDPWTVLLALGIVQGFLLAIVLLLFKSANRLGNRLLAVMVVLFSALLMEEFMEVSRLYKYYPKVLLMTFTLDAAFGPLIFLYVHSLSQRTSVKTAFLHLLPTVLLTLAYFAFHFLTPRGAFVWVDPKPTSVFIVLVNVKILYLLGYFAASWQFLRKAVSNINDIPANNRIQVRAIQKILLVLLVLTTGIYFIFDWNLAFPDSLPASDSFSVILIMGSIYMMVFFALRYPFVFTEVKALTYYEEKIQAVRQRSASKYSFLAPEQKERYTRQLLELMTTSKLYRNQQLKVEDVAERLAIPPHHLSQIINEVLEKNFYEFVNYYRVQEVKEKMVDPAEAHKTLLGIALDAGFNSKASFNRVFKEFTGTTPSAYKQRGT